MEVKDRPKREADLSRLVGGKFNMQGNLHLRLVLGCHKTNGSLHPSARILKVSIEALMSSVTYTIQMVCTVHSSLKAVSLKVTPTVGRVRRTYIPRTWRGMESLQLFGVSLWVFNHAFLMTSSNISFLIYYLLHSVDCDFHKEMNHIPFVNCVSKSYCTLPGLNKAS